jgi:hypothetical protein
MKFQVLCDRSNICKDKERNNDVCVFYRQGLEFRCGSGEKVYKIPDIRVEDELCYKSKQKLVESGNGKDLIVENPEKEKARLHEAVEREFQRIQNEMFPVR